jgi:hypothetical protein
LPFSVAALAHLDLEFFLEQALHPQPLSKVVEQHRPGMARQVLVPKTDVEFPYLSDYLLTVHSLGASVLAKWGLRNHHFCRERRHFAIHQGYDLIRCPWLQACT